MAGPRHVRLKHFLDDIWPWAADNARMGRYLQLLRQRDFALLWGGATISALGGGMSFVALLWLLIERGGTPADVGWLAAIYTAPVPGAPESLSLLDSRPASDRYSCR